MNNNIILRNYQAQIIHDVRKSIASGNSRIILQMHVGAGKTVVAADILSRSVAKFKRAVFLAPRRQLVYQASETFRNYGINTGIIMAGENRFNQPLVQVGSFDTITSRVRNGRMQIPEASLILVDEAHACFSKERLELLKHYPLVIGITATPARANGKGLGSFYTDIVEGPSMKDMVANNYLVPMRYFGADGPDLAAVKLNADGDYAENQLAEASDKPELIGSIYKNYRRIAGDRTTLIFAVNRAHARHIHDEFLAHGVTSDYIDGKTPTEEREAIKQRVMTGETKVIVNIGVMSFGTDWPVISCIIIARVTRNIAAWIQMVGRGSRLHPGKQDCLVIYHGHNFDELGRIDDAIEWSLDDKTTIRERKEKAKQEAKEPKDITCKKCQTIFSGRKTCPECGHEMISKGKDIPCHEAELKEITAVDKSSWYAQLVCYRMQKGYLPGWADHKFKEKFGHFPHKKYDVRPMKPTEEVINYIRYLDIKRARSAA